MIARIRSDRLVVAERGKGVRTFQHLHEATLLPHKRRRRGHASRYGWSAGQHKPHHLKPTKYIHTQTPTPTPQNRLRDMDGQLGNTNPTTSNQQSTQYTYTNAHTNTTKQAMRYGWSALLGWVCVCGCVCVCVCVCMYLCTLFFSVVGFVKNIHKTHTCASASTLQQHFCFPGSERWPPPPSAPGELVSGITCFRNIPERHIAAVTWESRETQWTRFPVGKFVTKKRR